MPLPDVYWTTTTGTTSLQLFPSPPNPMLVVVGGGGVRIWRRRPNVRNHPCLRPQSSLRISLHGLLPFFLLFTPFCPIILINSFLPLLPQYIILLTLMSSTFVLTVNHSGNLQTSPSKHSLPHLGGVAPKPHPLYFEYAVNDLNVQNFQKSSCLVQPYRPPSMINVAVLATQAKILAPQLCSVTHVCQL